MESSFGSVRRPDGRTGRLNELPARRTGPCRAPRPHRRSASQSDRQTDGYIYINTAGPTHLLVAQGLAKDAADETEVVEVVRVDGRHGRGLVGRPVRRRREEGVVLCLFRGRGRGRWIGVCGWGWGKCVVHTQKEVS